MDFSVQTSQTRALPEEQHAEVRENRQSCSLCAALGRFWNWLSAPSPLSPEARQAEIQSKASYLFDGTRIFNEIHPGLHLPEMTFDEAVDSATRIVKFQERVAAMSRDEYLKAFDDAMMSRFSSGF